MRTKPCGSYMERKRRRNSSAVTVSGDATSLSDANKMFSSFRLQLEIEPQEMENESSQIALLTALALARRVFLGGVHVRCRELTPLLVPLPLGTTLGEAVQCLGGQLGVGAQSRPLISVVNRPRQRSSDFHIRTAFGGWRGGILPAQSEIALDTKTTNPLAPMLAAALAVNEAFSFIRTGNSAVGRRPIGMSLWQPCPNTSWFTPTDNEPELCYLPARLWLLGLGHLGQAFLWALGILPYPDLTGATLVLQDFDVITPSTESTSVLTDSNLIGQKKTRAMAAWAERRGFATTIIERQFSADFQRQPDEPSVAFCGVDNAIARQAL